MTFQCLSIARYLILTVTFAVLAGCATSPYDYSAINESQPRSILVIPPLNNSVEVNASYTFLSVVSRPIAESGYYVFPVALIDTFLKENGLPTPGEMNSVPLDKLQLYTGADAILYTEILDWGQKYQVLQSKTVVKAAVKLLDARTGVLLWDAKVNARQTSGDGGGGLLGAIAGAVAEQIAGSITDKTPQLARASFTGVVFSRSSGLPPGPYRQLTE